MGGGHGKSTRGLAAGAEKVDEFGRFGQLFPSLSPLDVSEDKLQKLADAMLDDNGADKPDNKNIPAGYTYLGQFIDHDITLDVTPVGAQENDPAAVIDFRTPRLDLDSLYGNGPGANPSLYDRVDQRRIAIGTCGHGGGGDAKVNDKLPNDLLRTREGLAVIGDPRNDENLLVAQTHLAFAKFHNKVVDRIDPDKTGNPDQVFAQARLTVVRHYQWIVVNDFLARIADFNDVSDIRANGLKLFKFDETSAFKLPFMPIEFSAAAYRLGHSMVRERYSYNRPFNDAATPITFGFLFNFTGKSGGILGDRKDDPGIAAALKLVQPIILSEKLPGDWAIDWHRFYELGEPKPKPAGSGGGENSFRLNLSRPIDPFLEKTLHALPGGGKLPFLNLLRGVRLGLPSGQDVAREINRLGVTVPVLTPNEVASGPDGAVARQLGLDEATPLWYYILKEAEVKAGSQRLGPVGSRIVCEVFMGMLLADKESYLHQQDWKPTLPAANAGTYTMPDLLRFVDDLDPLNEPSNFSPPPPPAAATAVTG